MSRDDAYEDDMGLRMTEREIDRLFSGDSAASKLRDLSALIDEVRTYGSTPLEDQTRTNHLQAIAKQVEGVRAGSQQEGLGASEFATPLRPARLLLRLSGAAAAFMAVTAGLAFAGVDLPSAVDEVFDRVGISLPDGQSERTDGGSVMDDVQDAIDEVAPSERGCLFGMAISERAGRPAGAAGDPCARGHNGDARRDQGTGPGSGRRSEASSRREDGESKATDRRRDADDRPERPGEAPAGDRTGPAENKSSAGKDTADEATGGQSPGQAADPEPPAPRPTPTSPRSAPSQRDRAPSSSGAD